MNSIIDKLKEVFHMSKMDHNSPDDDHKKEDSDNSVPSNENESEEEKDDGDSIGE